MADDGFRFCGKFDGGFRFCSGANGCDSILWFDSVSLWWIGFMQVGLPAWVCGGCELRLVGFSGHGFRGSVMNVFRHWAWGVRWIWLVGDEGVPTCWVASNEGVLA